MPDSRCCKTSSSSIVGGRLCLSLNSTHASGEIAPGLFSACCQNGLGTAKGMLWVLIADMMKLGSDADGVSDFLALPQPSRSPQPFLSIGARLTMRYKEYSGPRTLMRVILLSIFMPSIGLILLM